MINLDGYNIFEDDLAALLNGVVTKLTEPGFHRVVTLNLELLMMSRQQSKLLEFMQSADYCLPDGIAVVKAIQWQSGKRLERLTGVRLAETVLQEGALSCYLIGASLSVMIDALEVIPRRYPKANIVGAHHGFFDADQWQWIVSDIKAKRPDMIFVGMGFPKQEQLLMVLADELDYGFGVGVGGSIDVLAGSLKRAPGWMQRMGLEWLYRLWQNPRRIGRLWVVVPFLKRYFFVKGTRSSR